MTDRQIEYAFVTAFNRVLVDKTRYIADYEPIIKMLTDTGALEKEAAGPQEKQEELYTRGSGFTPDERYENLIERYEATKTRLKEIGAEIASRSVKRTRIQGFFDEILAHGDILTEFDEALWRRTVERVIVYRESDVRVEFKDGRQVKVSVMGK